MVAVDGAHALQQQEQEQDKQQRKSKVVVGKVVDAQ
jgi:hypothetical protein